MSTTAAPTAMEMSKTIIDQIATAVANGGNPEDARAALADVLKNQGTAPAAAAAAAAAPKPGALTTAEEKITRPNGQDYWVRKVGDHHDVALVREARDRGINVLLTGEPGTGKTALIEAAFGSGGSPLYTVQGSGDTELADFVGGYVQVVSRASDGKEMIRYEWVDGPLLRAMEEGVPLYIDEIPLIDPKVLPGVYSLMDGRNELRVTQNPERGVVKAKEGFYIVAACNPKAPGARMSEALTSRFSLQFEVTTDYGLARRLGVPAKMVTAAQNMQRKVEKDEMSWAPQLRELLAFRDIASIYGEDTALANIVSISPEIDRSLVLDVMTRSFSKKISELKTSTS